jgi:hypothetical protein
MGYVIYINILYKVSITEEGMVTLGICSLKRGISSFPGILILRYIM